MILSNIKKLFRDKKRLFVLTALLVGAIVIIVLLFGKPLLGIPDFIPLDNSIPPVITTVSELKLVSVTPPEGKRDSPDTYTQTYLEFSTDVDEKSLYISVVPRIPIKAVVYKNQPRILIIEPAGSPWQSGVSYTITIQSLHGTNGEELTKPIEYRFTNTPPLYLEGGDPL